MTLEQYAYLGEIVAAIAVIASLIYIAQQVRQNTNMMRVSNSHNFVDSNMRLCTAVVTDHNLAELWVKAGSELDDLDATDRQRIVLFEWQAIMAWHNYFNLRQQNLVSDSQWHELTWIVANLGRRQSVQEAWKTYKGGYNKQFQEYMAQYLEPDLELEDLSSRYCPLLAKSGHSNAWQKPHHCRGFIVRTFFLSCPSLRRPVEG